MEWLREGFNPEEFDPESVEFDEPKERVQIGS
jgi:hypothetical protein